MKSTWYFKTALDMFIEANINGLQTNFNISPPIKKIQSAVSTNKVNKNNPENMVLHLSEGDFFVIMAALSYLAKVYNHVEKEYPLTDDQYSDLINDACFLNCLIPSLSEKYYPQNSNSNAFLDAEIPADILKPSAEWLLKEYL